MAGEIASAFVSLLPSARGFGSKLDSAISRDLDRSGRTSGSRFGSALKIGAATALTGAAGFGAVLAKGAVSLEAQFSQTMDTIAAVADVPKAQLKSLSDLAIKMGADTVFSANDASAAMLELAKGGISAANIRAGALAGTLTLAAAGGTDMATAATIASNAMNTFNLKGDQMGSVAAALAGGANASSASVESLGLALSQVGPGATNAGLSLQQTVAVLSAFDSAGIKGADAGTSLKTMLSRLVPQTAKASKAMGQLGLDFTNADGSFVSIENVARQLKTSLGGLSAEQRSQALTTIFGSDATRAATVLMREGAVGIGQFVKATNDQDAAQRVAAARMKGTAGSIEQFKGALETAQVQFGRFIAPAVIGGLGLLTKGLSNIGDAATPIGAVLKTVGSILGDNTEVIGTFLGVIGTAVVVTKLWTTAQALLNIVMTANPIGIVVVALAALAAGLVYAYKHSETFRAVVQRVGTFLRSTFQPVLTALVDVFRSRVAPTLAAIIDKFREWQPTIQRVIVVVVKIIGWVLALAATILAKVLPPLIRFAGFLLGAVVGAITTVIGWLVKIIGWVLDFGRKIVDQVKKVAEFVRGLKEKFSLALAFVRGIPGKLVDALGDLGRLLYNAGKALIQGLIDGITSKIGDVRDAIGLVADAAASFLPGSPIREGPLRSWNRGGAGKRLVGLLADGLRDTAPLDAAMREVASRVRLSGQRVPALALDDGPARLAAEGIGQQVNIGTFLAHDYQDFERQMGQKRQLAALGGRP